MDNGMNESAEDRAKMAHMHELMALQDRQASGARWFYWIGALSLVNSIAQLSGGNWSFCIGLGTTQVIDAIATGFQLGTTGKMIAFALDAVVSGLMLGFGFLAGKGMGWAYIVGMVLYAFDGLISFGCQDWLGLAFHGFAIFCIYGGWQANRQLKQLQARQASNTPPVA